MDEIIRIKCPCGKVVLSVKNQPGIETRNVTCPDCKKRFPFTEFQRLTPSNATDDGNTEYVGQYSPTNSDTLFAPRQNNITGRIIVEDSGRTFRLKPGRNIIGRKAQKSMADIRIDTADKRAMSREHIVIEVNKVPSLGFVHYISLYKERVNPTFVGKNELLYGDRIVLNHGDVINLPDAALLFEIPNEDDTPNID